MFSKIRVDPCVHKFTSDFENIIRFLNTVRNKNLNIKIKINV